MMGYEYDSYEGISGKKMAILFGLAAFGVFLFLAIIVFPITNLFREEITEQAVVVSKDGITCVVETSDHPRAIENCNYDVGNVLIVSFKAGTAPIIKHYLKE